MKISYDAEIDSLYIEFRSLAPSTAENRELTDGIIANYGPDGKLAGLEILDASQVLGRSPQERTLIFEVASVPTPASTA
jgi:uncharacterized protein YuzE